MRVTLLGTGGSAGVPMIGGADGHGDWGVCDRAEPRNRRTRASILIDGGAGALLVDTPPDMRGQLLACGVGGVDAMLFTHAHADHITGLDDVRILNRIVDRPLDAFATAETIAELERRFGYAFRPWQPPGFFRPVLVPRPVGTGRDGRGRRHGRCGCSTRTTASPARSACASAVSATRPTWWRSMKPRSRRLPGSIPGWSAASSAQPHRTHAWLSRVLEWAARLAPRRTVLTHMGTDMDWAWLAGQPAGRRRGRAMTGRCSTFPLTPCQASHACGASAADGAGRDVGDAAVLDERQVATTGFSAAAGLAALGIVYGDLGTSPLYAMQAVLGSVAATRPHWRRWASSA